MKPQRILVTGAAGFIGWHFCRTLLDAGHRVCGMDNLDPYYDPRIKLANIGDLSGFTRFRFVQGDVRDRSLLDEALGGIDAVVHLAARPGVRQSLEQPALYESVNVGGTRALLDACGTHGVRAVLFASSSSVYGQGTAPPFREDVPLGRPLSPYAVTKQAGERLAQEFADLAGARAAVLRLFSVYGRRQRPDLALHAFATRIAQGEALPQFGDGSTVRDYTHVADVVAGMMAALAWALEGDPDSQTFNLGTGRPVELHYLIAKLAAAMGVEPRIERRPGHPADLPCAWADMAKARSVLGYEPQMDLDAGIADFVTWFEETHGH